MQSMLWRNILTWHVASVRISSSAEKEKNNMIYDFIRRLSMDSLISPFKVPRKLK